MENQRPDPRAPLDQPPDLQEQLRWRSRAATAEDRPKPVGIISADSSQSLEYGPEGDPFPVGETAPAGRIVAPMPRPANSSATNRDFPTPAA